MNKNPIVFISYSWDNESHKEWVLALADRLCNNGVDVQLDRYNLKAGKDMTFFMEKSVQEADHVLLIMTPNYKLKAEQRKGGVGYEISMITSEIYANQKTEKFIPIVRIGGREKCVPLFVKNRIDIDMREDSLFEANIEELLRTIYNEHIIEKPKLGTKPMFSNNTSGGIKLDNKDLIQESKILQTENEDYAEGFIKDTDIICPKDLYSRWYSKFKRGNKYGIFRENNYDIIGCPPPVGSIIIPPIFDDITGIAPISQIFIVKLKDKYGVYSGSRLIIQPEFDNIIIEDDFMFSHRGGQICKDGKWGFFDGFGISIECKYDSIIKHFNGEGTNSYALVRLNNKNIKINKKGKRIWLDW